jgi:hypothetical protein
MNQSNGVQTMNDTEKLILVELYARELEIAELPDPPAWKRWEVEPLQLDREFGPSYSPTWFDDLTATNAGRQRFLRAIYDLEGRGLLEVIRSQRGRLERLRTTEAGRKAIESD